MAFEKLIGLEVEDEDGNVQVLRIRRLVTQEEGAHTNPEAVFSNELVFRPGPGMAIARRLDTRQITTIDDSEADARERQGREIAAMRERSLTEARVGGEEGILPDQDRAPARRSRRGRGGGRGGAATAAPPAA